VRLRPEPQQALAVHHGAHGVGRVGDQIHHDLPQLNHVGGNRRKPVGQVHIDRHAVIFQVAAQQREHLADQRIDVQRGHRHAVVPEHQADFVDDCTGAVAVADNAFECGAGLLNPQCPSVCHEAQIVSPPAEVASAPSTTSVSPEDRAERRQVTVMFSDLVGSTALSARMDAEDLREVISAYQKCIAQTVGRFGGFVAKYMGDGVLVYFGYPHAHEDDAERAVRAGLELVAAVSGLKTHAALQTRVGIATGLVVVGHLIGSGASQEQAIVGETPNLAARLQGVKAVGETRPDDNQQLSNSRDRRRWSGGRIGVTEDAKTAPRPR
jgi:hypothetical protein